MPTYVFHGSDDPLVPVGASAILEGKGNVTRQVHEGLRHECHHEPEHEDVLAGVVVWIRANVPADAAGVPAEAADEGFGAGVDSAHNRIPPPGSALALRVWRRPQTRGT